MSERIVPAIAPCPACGGAGGGPFGPAGSAWDDEEYVCAKCEGEGVIALPGVVKATPPYAARAEDAEEKKRKATG
jgi:hypothetical protein